MNEINPKTSAKSGGIFVAAGMLGGALLGIYFGQPSAGMLIGLGTGSAIAIAVWVLDRRTARK